MAYSRLSILLAVALLSVVFVGVSEAAPKKTLANWSAHEQKLVIKHGLLPKWPDGKFHGEKPLSAKAYRKALRKLANKLDKNPAKVKGPVTVVRFDAALVRQLGLRSQAHQFQTKARKAKLRPPGYFGSEVVTRLLELRYNHPAELDRLELYPHQKITRAEAAYSLAKALRLSDWQLDEVRQDALEFRLPRYGKLRLRALRTAASRIAMPYIWGGEADTTYHPLTGAQLNGGYDCSGFVWRVFKLAGHKFGSRIGGRTAAQMAAEIPRQYRKPFGKIKPGDLLFFGSAKFGSKVSEENVTHVGIALSKNWMIHSSSQGVYLAKLSGWRKESFVFARRL